MPNLEDVQPGDRSSIEAGRVEPLVTKSDFEALINGDYRNFIDLLNKLNKALQAQDIDAVRSAADELIELSAKANDHGKLNVSHSIFERNWRDDQITVVNRLMDGIRMTRSHCYKLLNDEVALVDSPTFSGLLELFEPDESSLISNRSES